MTAFGTNGVVRSSPNGLNSGANAVASDANSLYLVGFDHVATLNSEWRIEKRNKSDGNLDAAFGVGGVVQSNPSGSFDEAFGIALDASALYVIGFDSAPGNTQWRIEKRDLTTGALVAAFGASGAITINPTALRDEAYCIAIDAGAIYIGGMSVVSGLDWQWRIEKRTLADGNPDLGFGTNGVITTNPSGYDEAVRSILHDGTSLYLAGGDGIPGDYQWRIEKRNPATGALVTSFGTAGVLSSNPSPGNDEAMSITSDATHLYIAGYDETNGSAQWRIEKRTK